MDNIKIKIEKYLYERTTSHLFEKIVINIKFITTIVLCLSVVFWFSSLEMKPINEVIELIMLYGSLNFLLFLGLEFLPKGLQKRKYNRENKEREEEVLQIRIIREREAKEKELLRQNVDLVLEKVENEGKDTVYRLMLYRGDGSKEILIYKASIYYEMPKMLKPIELFEFRKIEYTSEYVSEFPEESLPTLKRIIQHYQKYGNLEPAPPVITPVERFIISRQQEEPPPDLKGLDTVESLVPLLIEAERENNHYAINKVLDKMESINNTQLTICR